MCVWQGDSYCGLLEGDVCLLYATFGVNSCATGCSIVQGGCGENVWMFMQTFSLLKTLPAARGVGYSTDKYVWLAMNS